MSSKVNVILDADNGLWVKALLAETAPSISGGYGGWEVVARPHRVSLTNWIGRDPVRMALPIMFDGFIAGDSIEPNITQLTRMGQPDDDGEPPTLKVHGAVPRKDVSKWVIESLDWGTNIIWGMNPNGVSVRVRQDVTVNLLQFVAPDRAQLGGIQPPRPLPKKGRPKPRHKFHVIKKGDTIAKISTAEYGASLYQHDIAVANGIRDPKVITTKKWLGKSLRMP